MVEVARTVIDLSVLQGVLRTLDERPGQEWATAAGDGVFLILTSDGFGHAFLRVEAPDW